MLYDCVLNCFLKFTFETIVVVDVVEEEDVVSIVVVFVVVCELVVE
jgi:hypothetical protein